MTEIATTTSTITAIWLAARKIYNTLYYFTADQSLVLVVLVRLLQTAPEFTHEYAHLTVLVVTSLLLLPSCSLLIGCCSTGTRCTFRLTHAHACTELHLDYTNPISSLFSRIERPCIGYSDVLVCPNVKGFFEWKLPELRLLRWQMGQQYHPLPTRCHRCSTFVPPTHAHHVVSFALSSSSLRCGCSCVVVPPYTDTPGLEPFLCVFSYDFYVFVYVLLFLSRCAASLLLTWHFFLFFYSALFT